jgi:CRISPR system Cascade subunit CasB
MTEEMTLDDKARIAWGWWRKLNPPPDSSQPGDRAALAMLRRAAEPREIWLIDAYQDLRQRLRAGNDLNDRVAVLAHVLAHVRDEPKPARTFAAALGATPEGGTPLKDHVVSPLRFKRLIEARDPVDLMREFRRAVRLLGGSANVSDLAKSVLAWSDQTRKHWSFAYFGAASADPDSTSASQADAAAALPQSEAMP